MSKIKKIKARQIIDSRATPTVETTVLLDNGVTAKAGVPSGASTGTHETLELRDGDMEMYAGKSVYKAVEIVNSEINKLLNGMEITSQTEIDGKMLTLDGTLNKSRLGANSILSVSLACARAAAIDQNLQLYKYISSLFDAEIKPVPVRPLFNVINGGMHAGGSVSFQEFFVIPQSKSFQESLKVGCELYHSLKKSLDSENLNTNVGDEGGFAPHFSSNTDVLDFLRDETKNKGFRLGLDIASSTFYKEGKYSPEGKALTPLEYLHFMENLAVEFDLEVLEDALFEDDWANWTEMTRKLGSKVRLIGDDLLVTNKTRLTRAIKEKAANGILVKVNQIGSLTETLEVVRLARQNKFTVIVSHRSGETNDDFIADLAVGVSADFVKFGAPARGERVAKYNRLLEIYENEI